MTKSEIIAEIQRTAAENGGRALGVARFEAATGIREGDWFGKYWSRWSDAVREAGLKPNELQQSFDENEILEKYARLAQELRLLPGKGELLLKRRADNSFPSLGPFKRFGGRSALIERVSAFCRERPEYSDVAKMCEQIGTTRVTKDDQAEESVDQGDEGYVYLIKSSGYYKIGKSKSVGRREYELAIQLPEKVQLVHRIRTDDPTGIEAYWHGRFVTKRVNGEWFKLDSSDIAAFRRRKFM